jgi:hypothetical protein
VTVAGSDLGRLRRAFADTGLETDYGGPHSNGITHMALLGFDDGSYIELISTLERGVTSPWWPRQIAEDGGPCAWCVRVPDMDAECSRLMSLGIPVRGPQSYHRERPDGLRVEWELAFPGSGEPGAILPFLIQDRTPRELRVRPSPSLRDGDLAGIAAVVLGVHDLVWSAQLFEQAYGWSTRETRPDPELGATVVYFTGTPVALAAPLVPDSWLGRRLAQFGESPAAFLLRSHDLGASARRLVKARAGTWLSRPALWLDEEPLGARLGII